MTIKFNDVNQSELEYIEALETEAHYNGSNRRVLTITCAADAMSVDALNAILSTEQNVAHLTLTNEDANITNIIDGYVLKINVGIENMVVQEETPESPEVRGDRLVFELGKRTFIEQQLVNLGVM